MKPIVQVFLSISSIQHREKKIATLLIFLSQGVSEETANVEGERKHLLPRSKCGQKKNSEDVTMEQLQVEARCIDQHPGFEETGEG